MSDIVIRDAGFKDYGFLCVAFSEVNAQHCEMRPGLYRPLREKSIPPIEKYSGLLALNKLGLGPYFLRIAEKGNKPVGAVFAQSKKSNFMDSLKFPAQVYLDNIVVLPKHREEGVGEALLDSTKQWAVKKNCGRIYAKIVASNEGSLSLFRNAGYREDQKVMGKVLPLEKAKKEALFVRDVHPTDEDRELLHQFFMKENEYRCTMQPNFHAPFDPVELEKKLDSAIGESLGSRTTCMQIAHDNEYCPAIGALLAQSQERSNLSWSAFTREVSLDVLSILSQDRFERTGLRLLNSLEKWAIEKDSGRIYTLVDPQDIKSMALFKKADYTVDHINMGLVLDR